MLRFFGFIALLPQKYVTLAKNLSMIAKVSQGHVFLREESKKPKEPKHDSQNQLRSRISEKYVTLADFGYHA
jgi:hypothetical protein